MLYLCHDVHPVANTAGYGGHYEPIPPVALRWSIPRQCPLITMLCHAEALTPAVGPIAQRTDMRGTPAASSSDYSGIHNHFATGEEKKEGEAHSVMKRLCRRLVLTICRFLLG